MSVSSQVAKYEAEILRLQYRVEELEAALGMTGIAVNPFLRLGLTPVPAQMLQILVKSGSISRRAMFNALYAGKASYKDEPGDQVLSVHLYKIRRALATHGLKVEVIWCVGWRLSPDCRARLQEFAKTGVMPPQGFGAITEAGDQP